MRGSTAQSRQRKGGTSAAPGYTESAAACLLPIRGVQVVAADEGARLGRSLEAHALGAIDVPVVGEQQRVMRARSTWCGHPLECSSTYHGVSGSARFEVRNGTRRAYLRVGDGLDTGTTFVWRDTTGSAGEMSYGMRGRGARAEHRVVMN